MPTTLEEAIQIILKLQEQVKVLEELLNSNSSNSSKPPSSDRKKEKKKSPTGRKQGGQPNHKAHNRKLVSKEEVTATIECEPKSECECGGCIRSTGSYKRHQVTDIPDKIELTITEYQLKYGKCESCGKSHKAELPKGVSTRWFGTNVQAQLSELTTKYKMSRRDAVKFLESAYGFKLCLGSVSNYEELTSQALVQSYEEIKSEINKSEDKNVDETGYSQNGIRKYAWIVITKKYALFSCNRSRGKRVAKELIGENYGGFVTTDRFSSYDWLDPEKRQVCWAHLKRDFKKISQRGGDSEIIGNALLEYCKKMFVLWKEFLASSAQNARDILREKIKPLRTAVELHLEKGTRCSHLNTQRTCAKMLKLSCSLWTFIDFENVEPTNNHAERGLRLLVLHRKNSFGTQSDRGSKFIERMLSIVVSANLMKISVIEFVKKAITAFKCKTKCDSFV